jgi:hypothetical protein
MLSDSTPTRRPGGGQWIQVPGEPPRALDPKGDLLEYAYEHRDEVHWPSLKKDNAVAAEQAELRVKIGKLLDVKSLLQQ